MINTKQLSEFNEKGYVIIENAVSESDIKAIKNQIDKWTHESRNHDQNYGRLIDGQPRFDLEPGHSRIRPKLRRITNPVEVSEHIKKVVFHGAITELLVPILGESIKFDHCKINAKYPGMKADVKYHQDHIFEPQTNDSVVVALLALDDTTVENGCLKVVPGSHKTRYSHSENGSFSGRVDDSLASRFDAEAELIEAKAGSVCLMDTWTVHGSSMNSSTDPRRLLITEYKSADAFPLTTHKLPSRYMDSVIRGVDVDAPRYRPELNFEIPEFYQGDSLFDLQDIVEANREQELLAG
jgi:ectoine hydroxylase-related dioxygenase (phytanoyl-CoA dioxygenase family)